MVIRNICSFVFACCLRCEVAVACGFGSRVGVASADALWFTWLLVVSSAVLSQGFNQYLFSFGSRSGKFCCEVAVKCLVQVCVSLSCNGGAINHLLYCSLLQWAAKYAGGGYYNHAWLSRRRVLRGCLMRLGLGIVGGNGIVGVGSLA